MIEYDYNCPDCGAHLSVRHSIKENPSIACPECSAIMSRQLGNPEYIAVKGGRPSSASERQQSEKEQAEVADAKKLVSKLGEWRDKSKAKQKTKPEAPRPTKKKELPNTAARTSDNSAPDRHKVDPTAKS